MLGFGEEFRGRLVSDGDGSGVVDWMLGGNPRPDVIAGVPLINPDWTR